MLGPLGLQDNMKAVVKKLTAHQINITSVDMVKTNGYMLFRTDKRAGDPKKLMLKEDPTSFTAHEVHGLKKELFAVVSLGSSSRVLKQ
ncbi:hypothetical protein llap_7408 [Limosa lapponica baueri]|uniref:Uncharacterized protein n=1 Tax=Limosa lapponica baueri TaxID=1758121 RepID=A0A2I0U8C3_LIMLA|nr:hypothetical protein llap_7408 [Limosa lapponica baueri]